MATEKKCCVPSCGSSTEILHKFPNPEKDPNRFLTWTSRIGGKILLLNDMYVFKYRRICHLHFETKYHTRSKMLSANAVPTLGLKGRLGKHEPETSRTASVGKTDDETNKDRGEKHEPEIFQTASVGITDYVANKDNAAVQDQNDDQPDDTYDLIETEECFDETVEVKEHRACRGCLTTFGKLEMITDVQKRIFETVTSLTISEDDGYPYYFCVACCAHIKKALAFRRRARRTNFILKEIMDVKKEISFEDICTVDRKKTNLDQALSVWDPKTVSYYTIDKSKDVMTKEPLDFVDSVATVECQGVVVESGVEQPIENDTQNVPIDETYIDDDTQVVDLVEGDNEVGDEIDLNDVFKGLKEEPPTPEVSDAEDVEEEHIDEKKEKDNKSNRHKAMVLSRFDIEILPLEEQRRLFEQSLLAEPFSSSMFKCGICVIVYDNMDDLIEHCTYHLQMSRGTYLCEICKARFPTMEAQQEHQAECHSFKYTCKYCSEVCFKMSDIMNHRCPNWVIKKGEDKETVNAQINIHYTISKLDQQAMYNFKNRVGSYKACRHCGMQFDSKRSYESHIKLHRPLKSKTLSVCDICRANAATPRTLQKHMEKWHLYLYTCKECGYVAHNRYDAVDHMNLQHRTLETKYFCQICNKSCKSEAALKFHVRHFHYSDYYCIHCAICGLSFPSKFSLYYHYLNQHRYIRIVPEDDWASKPFACFHCQFAFNSKEAYNVHIVRHKHPEAEDIPYKCIPCKLVFSTEEEMDKHILDCRYYVFPKPCRYCGEEIKNSASYYQHCLRSHPNCQMLYGKKKLCETCGLSVTVTKWSKHACHTEPQPKELCCPVCEARFSLPFRYATHMLYKHTDKPFHCSLCSAKFSRRFKCKDHILKVHTPCRPYVCEICDRSFSHLDYLNSHFEKMHDISIKKDPRYKRTSALKCRFYTYPHMKIDISNIDTDILNKLKLKITGYIEDKFELVIDPREYYVTSNRNKDYGDDDDEEPETKRLKVEEPLEVHEQDIDEIVEIDGQRYVTINGVVYEIRDE